jgi:hypothetical protein
MKRVMVRYRLKAECVDDNVRLVRAVFDELARAAPTGIRYTTFQLPDRVSFVHLASIETADGSNPLLALDAFRAFSAAIKDRCEEPPATAELSEVGNYRVFDA